MINKNKFMRKWVVLKQMLDVTSNFIVPEPKTNELQGKQLEMEVILCRELKRVELVITRFKRLYKHIPNYEDYTSDYKETLSEIQMRITQSLHKALDNQLGQDVIDSHNRVLMLLSEIEN